MRLNVNMNRNGLLKTDAIWQQPRASIDRRTTATTNVHTSGYRPAPSHCSRTGSSTADRASAGPPGSGAALQ